MALGNDQPLFREEAFARRGRLEPLDGLLRVTAPHEWAILAALTLAFLGVVLWGLFGSVERSFSAQCILALPGERHAVVSETAGIVVDVLTQPGDTVKIGQPIARIRVRELDHDVRTAQSRFELIEEHVSESSDDAVQTLVAAARAELLQLQALQNSGEYIVSPQFGEVTAQNLRLGQEVTASSRVAEIRASTDQQFEAITLVSPEDAQRLSVGMEAQIIPRDSRATKVTALEAEVAYISHHPALPDAWLVSYGLWLPGNNSQMVRLALREPQLAATNGDPCRVRVILRREAPVRLLVSPGSG